MSAEVETNPSTAPSSKAVKFERYETIEELKALLAGGPTTFRLPKRRDGRQNPTPSVRSSLPTFANPSHSLNQTQEQTLDQNLRTSHALEFLENEIEARKEKMKNWDMMLNGSGPGGKPLENGRLGGARANLKKSEEERYGSWRPNWTTFGLKAAREKAYEIDKKWVEELESKISAQKTAIKELETKHAAAKAKEEKRQEAFQKARSAFQRGDAAQAEGFIADADSLAKEMQGDLRAGFNIATQQIDLDYRRHMADLQNLNDDLRKVEESATRWEGRLRVVQKVCIISAAAITTTLTGGAAAGFWGPVLLGTLAGGGLSALCNMAELGAQQTYGTRDVTWGDVKAKALDTGYTTIECFVTCFGAGWAAKSARALQGVGHLAENAGRLQKIGAFLSRWRQGGQLALRGQLPTTIVNTGKEMHAAWKDPNDNLEFGWNDLVARGGELALACFTGGLGQQFAAFRTGLTGQAANLTSRQVTTSSFNAISRGQIGRVFLNLSSHGTEAMWGAMGTYATIEFSENIRGEELTAAQKEDMYIAAITGQVTGMGTERIQNSAAARAVDAQGTTQARVDQAEAHIQHRTGIEAPDPTTRPETDVQLGARSGAPGQNPRRVNLGDDLTNMPDRIVAEGANVKRQQLRANDKATGGTIKENLKPAIEEVSAVMKSSNMDQDGMLGRRGHAESEVKARLEDAVLDESLVGRVDPKDPASVAKYQQGAEEAISTNRVATTEYVGGGGKDKYIRNMWQGLKKPAPPKPDAGVIELTIYHCAKRPTSWLLTRSPDVVFNAVSKPWRFLTNPPDPSPTAGAFRRFVHGGQKHVVARVAQFAEGFASLKLVHNAFADATFRWTTFVGERTLGPRVLFEAVAESSRFLNNGTRFVRRKLGIVLSRPRDAAAALVRRTQLDRKIAQFDDIEAGGGLLDPKLRKSLVRERADADMVFRECNTRIVRPLAVAAKLWHDTPILGRVTRAIGAKIEGAGNWLVGQGRTVRWIRGEGFIPGTKFTFGDIPFVGTFLRHGPTGMTQGLGMALRGFGSRFRQPTGRYTHVFGEEGAVIELTSIMRQTMEAQSSLDTVTQIKSLEVELKRGVTRKTSARTDVDKVFAERAEFQRNLKVLREVVADEGRQRVVTDPDGTTRVVDDPGVRTEILQRLRTHVDQELGNLKGKIDKLRAEVDELRPKAVEKDAPPPKPTEPGKKLTPAEVKKRKDARRAYLDRQQKKRDAAQRKLDAAEKKLAGLVEQHFNIVGRKGDIDAEISSLMSGNTLQRVHSKWATGETKTALYEILDGRPASFKADEFEHHLMRHEDLSSPKQHQKLLENLRKRAVTKHQTEAVRRIDRIKDLADNLDTAFKTDNTPAQTRAEIETVLRGSGLSPAQQLRALHQARARYQDTTVDAVIKARTQEYLKTLPEEGTWGSSERALHDLAKRARQGRMRKADANDKNPSKPVPADREHGVAETESARAARLISEKQNATIDGATGAEGRSLRRAVAEANRAGLTSADDVKARVTSITDSPEDASLAWATRAMRKEARKVNDPNLRVSQRNAARKRLRELVGKPYDDVLAVVKDVEVARVKAEKMLEKVVEVGLKSHNPEIDAYYQKISQSTRVLAEVRRNLVDLGEMRSELGYLFNRPTRTSSGRPEKRASAWDLDPEAADYAAIDRHRNVQETDIARTVEGLRQQGYLRQDHVQRRGLAHRFVRDVLSLTGLCEPGYTWQGITRPNRGQCSYAELDATIANPATARNSEIQQMARDAAAMTARYEADPSNTTLKQDLIKLRQDLQAEIGGQQFSRDTAPVVHKARTKAQQLFSWLYAPAATP